jgi:hypothetical protein
MQSVHRQSIDAFIVRARERRAVALWAAATRYDLNFFVIKLSFYKYIFCVSHIKKASKIIKNINALSRFKLIVFSLTDKISLSLSLLLSIAPTLTHTQSHPPRPLSRLPCRPPPPPSLARCAVSRVARTLYATTVCAEAVPVGRQSAGQAGAEAVAASRGGDERCGREGARARANMHSSKEQCKLRTIHM